MELRRKIIARLIFISLLWRLVAMSVSSQNRLSVVPADRQVGRNTRNSICFSLFLFSQFFLRETQDRLFVTQELEPKKVSMSMKKWISSSIGILLTCRILVI
jgi:hypothetical protein